jgi:hypothetical protein
VTPPDEQKLGELIEAVRTVQGGLQEVKDGMADMRKENAEDHSKVIDAMGKLAAKDEVKTVADRTDKLESRSDKLMAIVGLIVLLCTVAPGLLILLTGGH